MPNLVVLAWILKYSVEEFSEYEIEQIQDMIEGEPDISRIRLEPGLSAIPLLHRFHKEKIDGLPMENRIREEGIIYFDILFYVRLPEEDELIKMIINVDYSEIGISWRLRTSFCCRLSPEDFSIVREWYHARCEENSDHRIMGISKK